MLNPKLFGTDDLGRVLGTGAQLVRDLASSGSARKAEQRVATLSDEQLRCIALERVWCFRQGPTPSDDYYEWQHADGYLAEPRTKDE